MLEDRFDEEETVSIMAVRRYDYKEYVRFCESQDEEPFSFSEWEEYMC